MASPRSAMARKTHTDEKLFRATVDLLRTGGARAVTVEAVAAASGVAKTTIYRRYDDRIAMLEATLDHYGPQLGTVADDDPRSGLVALARTVTAVIEDLVGMSLVTLLTAADGEPAARVVRERVIQTRIDQMGAVLTRWKSAGALRSDLDVDLTVSTLMGTIGVTYARHGSFPPGWPERFVEHLWPLLRPPA